MPWSPWRPRPVNWNCAWPSLIIAYDLLHGMMILKNACITLASRCIVGITANREVCRNYVENSIGLVTALVPVIGYENQRHRQGSLEERRQRLQLVLEKGWLTKENLDDMLRPENMTDPREIPR
jgi:aspartate ammonia-lyase